MRSRLPARSPTYFLPKPCGIDCIADGLKRHILTGGIVRKPNKSDRRRNSSKFHFQTAKARRRAVIRHSAELLLNCIQCLWISQGARGPCISVFFGLGRCLCRDRSSSCSGLADEEHVCMDEYLGWLPQEPTWRCMPLQEFFGASSPFSRQ